MINKDRWINSIAKANIRSSEKINQVDHNRWVKTIPIPEVNTNKSSKKYLLTAILFVGSLLLVSAVKNETRNIQKEINNLEASINVLKFNLDQALLDNEVVTSPENISQLAKEYLDNDFVFYKKSQIKNLNDKAEVFTTVKKIKINKEANMGHSENIKIQIKKKIDKTKTEVRKLQALYNHPKTIPDEIKKQVAKKIEKKKGELKRLYTSPKEVITLEKVQKWAAVQVVKVFLGIPIVPGK